MTMTSLQTRIADLENRIFGWKADYAFHRFMLALKAGFNREQPRDEWGRWTTGGGHCHNVGRILYGHSKHRRDIRRSERYSDGCHKWA
jgi:hypothetical protein